MLPKSSASTSFVTLAWPDYRLVASRAYSPTATVQRRALRRSRAGQLQRAVPEIALTDDRIASRHGLAL